MTSVAYLPHDRNRKIMLARRLGRPRLHQLADMRKATSQERQKGGRKGSEGRSVSWLGRSSLLQGRFASIRRAGEQKIFVEHDLAPSLAVHVR